MKVSTALSLLAAGVTRATVLPRATTSQDLCNGHAVEEAGNWYCQAVQQITYSNVGKIGSYQEVVNMDPATGQCAFAPKEVSSPMAPFDEGLSMHFRGPIILKQAAVYVPGAPSTKRDETPKRAEPHRHSHDKKRRHGHGHMHRRSHKARFAEAPSPVEQKRDEHPTIWVTATIDGKVVSWINDYWGPSDPTPAPAVNSKPPVVAAAAATTPTTTAAAQPIPEKYAPVASSSPSSASVAASVPSAVASPNPVSASSPAAIIPQPSINPAASAGVSSDYTRTAYYSADSGTSSGLTFLGNYGGVAGSGAWTPTFGNTLSYLSSSGLTGAASPQTLTNTTIPSGKEFAIFSDQKCGENGVDCGYVQPGSVGYAGFPGADKVFLFEFQMPHDQSPAGEQTDVPALWLLNAKIPLTGQYSGCSCWQTGCGEFDVFEVLNPGNDKAKSTFHSTFLGGDSNYFQRPVESSIKVAVVFDSGSRSVSVKVLDRGVEFGAGLGVEQVRSFMDDSSSSGTGNMKSLFKIAS